MTTIASTVRAELLDCIQANLAVLADQHHGPDSHLALGVALRFRPTPGATGLPTVEPALTSQIDEAIQLLGLVGRSRWQGLSAAQLRDAAEHHGPLYAVADTYEMPWLPYAGQRHMEHSFLVTSTGDRAMITDAYHNQTQWGLASPGQWELGWDELPTTTSLVVLLEPAISGAPILTPFVDCGPAADYLAAYAGHPDRMSTLDQLAVETWLLARSRKLHAAFLVRSGELDRPALAAHLRRWDRVAGQVFLALRRVQRGRPEPQHVLGELASVLAADRDVFGAIVNHTSDA